MPIDQAGFNESADALMNDTTSATKMDDLATASGCTVNQAVHAFVRYVYPEYNNIDSAYARALAQHVSWVNFLDLFINGDPTILNIVDYWD